MFCSRKTFTFTFTVEKMTKKLLILQFPFVPHGNAIKEKLFDFGVKYDLPPLFYLELRLKIRILAMQVFSPFFRLHSVSCVGRVAQSV